MPELLEAELYRRLAAEATGRRIVGVDLHDPSYLRGGTPEELDAVAGARIEAVDRHGKLVLVRTGAGTLGLHFGMSGRLLLDGRAAIDRLSYAGTRDDPAWDRVVLRTSGGGGLAVRDPRRLGWIELEPDVARLGPDAWGLAPAALRRALDGARTALKARLLDQARVAGLGNLLVDELLWRASLSPGRPAGSLSVADYRRLHRHLVALLPELLERGGSHTGDLVPHRRAGGRCPRDGAPLRTATVGGRTTWWCPVHQRAR